MGANHVRAMGLTLRGPDELCNCCDTKQGKDRSGGGFLFGGNTTSEPKWQQQAQPTLTNELGQEESWSSRRPTPPKPATAVQSECHQEDNEDLVGTFITDNFALPGPAQVTSNKSPSRSLFQSHEWRRNSISSERPATSSTCSSCSSSCSDSESSDVESDDDSIPHHAAQCQPVFITHDTAKENRGLVDCTHFEDIAQHVTSAAHSKAELSCLDSDSDYTADTDSVEQSPCLHTHAATTDKDMPGDTMENWATLGQQVGSVLDHLRVENSKLVNSAMMHEYLYWAQYAHN